MNTYYNNPQTDRDQFDHLDINETFRISYDKWTGAGWQPKQTIEIFTVDPSLNGVRFSEFWSDYVDSFNFLPDEVDAIISNFDQSGIDECYYLEKESGTGEWETLSVLSLPQHLKEI